MSESVAGIIVEDKKYLLGKRKAGGSIGGKWEFPGGKVEKGESFKDALEREFIEELGININVRDFIVKKYFTCNDHSFTLYAYHIDVLSDNFEKNEHDEFKYFTLEELRTLGDDLADSDRLLLDHI